MLHIPREAIPTGAPTNVEIHRVRDGCSIADVGLSAIGAADVRAKVGLLVGIGVALHPAGPSVQFVASNTQGHGVSQDRFI